MKQWTYDLFNDLRWAVQIDQTLVDAHLITIERGGTVTYSTKTKFKRYYCFKKETTTNNNVPHGDLRTV